MNKIIEIKDLEKTFTNGEVTKVLCGVNFSIEKGEFVSIMGPSGSGKSTLLHILGFLDKQTSGQYLFNNIDNQTLSDDEIAHIRNKEIGFVFQSFNLLAKTNVLDNVKLPLLYSNVKEDKWDDLAKEAIELVSLTNRTYYDVSKLSGGEKQRVAIARALILNPQVIFADEPTGNLDSKSGQIIIQTLQKLNKEKGHTIVLITHERTTAEHAQRIIHILDGTVDSIEKVNIRRDAFKGYTK